MEEQPQTLQPVESKGFWTWVKNHRDLIALILACIIFYLVYHNDTQVIAGLTDQLYQCQHPLTINITEQAAQNLSPVIVP